MSDRFQAVLLLPATQEQFNTSSLPAGWSVDDWDNDGYTWEWIDSNATDTVDVDELLTTDLYARGGCAQIILKYNHSYLHESGDQVMVADHQSGP
ncbi:MAG: hypothetical protein GY854_13165 [Deltaproteobacteria bacterium]|nr:hypothetical protein [Deltaproteobacteria bacterium]